VHKSDVHFDNSVVMRMHLAVSGFLNFENWTLGLKVRRQLMKKKCFLPAPFFLSPIVECIRCSFACFISWFSGSMPSEWKSGLDILFRLD
jgi:hypothetical protein